jgi:DNA-binding response OmpR family regulator
MPLSRPSVLIVEDDLMICAMLREYLDHHGYRVCGMARTVRDAVALAQEKRPDLLIIEVHLADGDEGTDIVPQLKNLEPLGVLYATSHGLSLNSADGHACLRKPYREDELGRALEIVTQMVATGAVSPPFPSGFRLLRPAVVA